MHNKKNYNVPFLVSTALGLYRLAGRLGQPLLQAYLEKRGKRGKEDPNRIDERMGHASLPRPSGSLLWIHAASVGETLSTLPLIKAICQRWPDYRILLTSGTVTSARLAKEGLPAGVLHQYVPIDAPQAVDRFLDHWRPDVGMLVESEIWPNLITMARKKGTDLILINGRMSPGSFKSWQRARPLIRHVLGCFSAIFAQTPEDEARFQSLGASAASCVGNLKFAAAPLQTDPQRLQGTEKALAGRPRWLAASTHPGEEEALISTHCLLRANISDLVTIIVPRHPERGGQIAALFRHHGLAVSQRSAQQPLEKETEIYIADTLGELGLWYRIAEVVFVGKSLVAKGGQNPLEPAKLNCAIIYGPFHQNFQRIADEMKAAGALKQAADAADLAEIVNSLLESPKARDELAAAARGYAMTQGKVLDRLVQALAPYLENR
ncbi:MAG: 3-deoxy-D-manno-octulosonic acid transferase [Pseudomonadota bacterium]